MSWTIDSSKFIDGQKLADPVYLYNLFKAIEAAFELSNGFQDGLVRLKNQGSNPTAGKSGTLYERTNHCYFDDGTSMVCLTAQRTAIFSIGGTQTAGAKVPNLYMPFKATIDKVFIHVSTAPTGAALIVDVHKNGTTIFTDQGKRPSIAASGLYDESDTPDVTALAKNDILTVDVDQIGSTIAGADLVVQIRMKAVI